ncbi:hypothetical protein EMIHUDRAFT_206521 [Emiliania huxleyi CCMP1516]|uniref:GAG-pre-integrase domain-containing protein n=2 Tax=Emiliania huxleyi TaxID=2903 RepID=A0A0D3JM03_EMIH1|nr:hypothetical protein EMIHUDRAFT_206521 [Emiliania huxleyi CCMP1516]EOD24538.1 hypothetical protein EMIHUDRAFT_206521 [Emiliania huxleyi CCMP1516]|eukprot:XP_005776967.1 hypothetical protein EMIHUDRAFT_206521 [Emiliania huxleyi CCMP1516]
MATVYDQSLAPLKCDNGGTLLSRIAATTTSWGRLGHLCNVATLRLCGISPSSAFRLFAFAPAARRLWRGIRRALLVYTTTSPEPVISDAFAADTDDASSDPVCGSVFDAFDTTLIGPEERHKLPVRPSDHADYGLWHARLGHFGRNKIIGPLRYRGHPSQPTNRRVYTHFGERVASDLCGPFKLLPFSIHKFKFATNFGINLGHDPRRSKYLVYIPAVRRIISTADVIFDEFSFTTLGGAWQPFKIRGAVEQERPQVPEAIIVYYLGPGDGRAGGRRWNYLPKRAGGDGARTEVAGAVWRSLGYMYM